MHLIFLGAQLTKGSNFLHCWQEKYVISVLDKVGLSTCKPISGTMVSNVNIFLYDRELLDDPTSYQSIVYALNITLSSNMIYVTLLIKLANFCLQQSIHISML